VSNTTEWILDTEATRHSCANKDLMHDFEDALDGENVFIGNAATAGVMDKGKVLLQFTSENPLCLNNVLYIPSLRRNLVSNSLLDVVGFEVNQKAGKIIILRNGVFVGKRYRSGVFCSECYL